MLGLEAEFSYEQCLLFRSLAEAEVVREASKRQAQASVATEASGGGWYSWLVGSTEVRTDVLAGHGHRAPALCAPSRCCVVPWPWRVRRKYR